jgi:hypothetical protein
MSLQLAGDCYMRVGRAAEALPRLEWAKALRTRGQPS